IRFRHSIMTWPVAPCSFWQPVSFMLGVPEKANGLSKRLAILFDSVIGNRTAVRKGEKNEQKIECHAQPTILHRMHILLISIWFKRCICFRTPRKDPVSPLR
ncbi:MAG: hypothetical protein JXR29_02880, partial [Methylothermaceae bacterium]|nr:hypothetical protein [Methylothermaceae bacterium]